MTDLTTDQPANLSEAFDAASVYEDLHRHPELGFEEHRTAALAARHLERAGCAVTTGVGGTGVVGVLERGAGPTVLLRADMDALPVREETGLPYASTATVTRPDGSTASVMHACGHDVHTTCLLGAAYELGRDRSWAGRVLLVVQPAEELGQGARAMVADGVVERFGRPDVVLGQHVAPVPAGVLGIHRGPAFAASDSLDVRFFGRGGHGSRPEATCDPVLMASSFVVRVQSVVSRMIAGRNMAVVSVGAIHAGDAYNVIPDTAELKLSIRTFDPRVRATVLEAVERLARSEAAGAGAPRDPEVVNVQSHPAVVNDVAACDRVEAAFGALSGVAVVDPGVVTGSEDVGILADAAGAPCAYWLLGGSDPALFAGARTVPEIAAVVGGLPSNHSPHFAPSPTPTLAIGVAALTTAASAWLRTG
ncbi:amidohydrolase [Lapillicoccus jejuensis]|uniref:Hippurate hydrolase n=1 Tax=Lapillicoccus jejuensis TaxID=402171 RepID=A0A542DZJ5_9MICO|nr:amidohydrolase [Lapillicoccus jejuensis]TQJ08469.1 hippurate hydrolase [Lapillicoccus jejuensis]